MRRKRLTIGRRCLRWTLSAIVCALALGAVAAAQAGFPGKPGQVVFSSTFNGDRDIFVAAARWVGTSQPHARSAFRPHSELVRRREAHRVCQRPLGRDGDLPDEFRRLGSDAAHPRLGLCRPPHMTSDGRYVVYESKKRRQLGDPPHHARRCGEVDLTRNRASDRYPATSANGRLIAFSSNRGTTGTHIWVMNIEGSALKTRDGAQG